MVSGFSIEWYPSTVLPGARAALLLDEEGAEHLFPPEGVLTVEADCSGFGHSVPPG